MLWQGNIIQQRYQIVRLVGQGGQGAVFEAYDHRLRCTVALKQMLGSDPRLSQAFAREAHLLANLRHPALPRVIDYFTDEQGHFLVMEFIPGDDLMALLRQQGAPFPLEVVLRWADQLLSVLQYLHSHQPPILHRDIKPHNLKLCPDGQLILLDFGLAKGLPPSVYGQSAASGWSISGCTPRYAPPEQMDGRGTTPQSDLFALSATLYHLLTNQPPFERSVPRSPMRPAHQVHPQVTLEVSAILTQAMQPDPRRRPASARAMQMDLRNVYQGQTTVGISVIPGQPHSVGTHSSSTLGWMLPTALIAGVLAVIVALAVVIGIDAPLRKATRPTRIPAATRSLATLTAIGRQTAPVGTTLAPQEKGSATSTPQSTSTALHTTIAVPTLTSVSIPEQLMAATSTSAPTPIEATAEPLPATPVPTSPPALIEPVIATLTPLLPDLPVNTPISNPLPDPPLPNPPLPGIP